MEEFGGVLRSATCLAWLVSLCGFVVLGGCATPSTLADDKAKKLGLVRDVLYGTEFEHVVYRNKAAIESNRLHIYFGGDGLPWARANRVATDPTPRHVLALDLMAQDAQPSLYVGRPCYHGFATKSPCTPLLWTHQRYSPHVIDSMAAIIKQVIETEQPKQVVFIGYSGGGVIAMLLAPRFSEIRAVVTVAANLDTDKWADFHRYSPLQGSLNPALRAVLPPHIHQLHLLGEHDLNVPPGLVEAEIMRQPNSKLLRHQGFTHSCCWTRIWRDILAHSALHVP